MFFRTLFILLLVFVMSLSGVCSGFSQDNDDTAVDGTLSPDQVEDAFKNAMSRADREREQKQEELTSNLRLKLEQAREEWFLSQSQKRNSELNSLVDQNWEELSRFGPRIKYGYYLRGYAYSGNRIDIVKTSSLVATHTGHLNTTEKLYVERSHTPNVSDKNLFYFTVSTPVKVTFEYEQGNFVAVKTEYGDTTMDNGWPEEVKNKLMLF